MKMRSGLNRRSLLAGAAALPFLSACAAASPARGTAAVPLWLDGYSDREVFVPASRPAELQPEAPSERAAAPAHQVPAPREIRVSEDIEPGQILVLQEALLLWYVHGRGRAREYPVGLGRAGLEFEGEAIVGRKAEWPSWRPTDEMIARNPGHYAQFAGGVPGGPDNPLGARALYLYRDGIDTYYRIHGTDAPETIGTRVSNGCIRMLNQHVVDLYLRVPEGTRVRVIR